MAEKGKKLEHSTYFASFFHLTLEKLTELQESAQHLTNAPGAYSPLLNMNLFSKKQSKALHEYVWMQKNLPDLRVWLI